MRYFYEHAKLIHLDLTIQWFSISKYTWPVQEKKKKEIILLQFRLPMSRLSLNSNTQGEFIQGLCGRKKQMECVQSMYK